MCYHRPETATAPAPRVSRRAGERPSSVRVLIDYRPALRARTGVGEWVHSLVAALADGDGGDPLVDLTVFSSSWKDRLGPTPPGVKTIDRRVPVRVLNFCWHRLGWPPVESLAGAHFDVVHSPHPLVIPSRRAAQVITIHDLDFLDHPEWTLAEVRRDYPALVRQHARRAAQIIVPSRHTATQVETRLGVPRDMITLCPNGAPSWTPRPGWPEGGHILFVGAVAPRKNIGTLLDAYTRLLQRHAEVPPLVLAGPPTPQASQWLDAIERQPLRGHVRCTGYLSKDQLRGYYEDARVLVLPSFNEGFGLPALEAMTVGVPVVVSDQGALPEIVGDAGLVVDPTKPDALTDAIARMITDDVFARSCAARGVDRSAVYSWRTSAQSLAHAYEKAVAMTVDSRLSIVD